MMIQSFPRAILYDVRPLGSIEGGVTIGMDAVERIVPTNLEEEMRDSFMLYAMSVIMGRMLPDVRDGLKPVQRRILYAMNELGLQSNKPYRKSARIVGEVMGKYHPHGDMPIYEALAGMAQEFTMRYTLIDGQGNFGSIDGDPPGAMRYTEARLSKLAEEMLEDIEKNTVDFVPNFDSSLEEPVVLPSKVPNLLINGCSGIAVGMATKIPPHNLSEVVDGLLAMLENPDISVEELMQYIKGPDFPTGGVIYGKRGIEEAYTRGRGTIVLRARAHIEEVKGGRERIVITEIPYQVSGENLKEQIVRLYREKKIEGIAELQDLSSKDGIRICVELQRGVDSQVVLNKLYKHTQLQISFGIIMLAIVDGQPRILSLPLILKHFIEHRKQVVRRRTAYELERAEHRAHILEGLLIAVEKMDRIVEIVRLIGRSRSIENARDALMEEFGLSEAQAQAILEMRLQQLTGLERDKIKVEYDELLKKIRDLKEILASERKLISIIKQELLQLKREFGDQRRTEIVEQEVEELSAEDLIPDEDIVVTLSYGGYIKRIPLSQYRSFRRGGKGTRGGEMKEEDFVEHMLISTNHSFLLFFTDTGRVYCLKGYEVPEAGKHGKGKYIPNLIPIGEERITAVISIRGFSPDIYLVMVTRNGVIKKTTTSAFSYLQGVRGRGVTAITLDPQEELVGVELTDGDAELILVSASGMALRFSEREVRGMGRSARGVKAMRLREGDRVVGVERAVDEMFLLIVTENGYGKKVPISEFPRYSRGARGVICGKVTKETGEIVGAKAVREGDEIVLVTATGMLLRMDVEEIPTYSRTARGARLIRLGDGDRVTGLEKVEEGR
jgi:DNA gyrase subunit A